MKPRWGVYRGTEATVHSGAPAVKAVWDMVLEDTPCWPVTVTFALPDTAAMPALYIDAALPEGWVITDVEFPRLTLKQIPDGKAILPIAYGCEYNLTRSGSLKTRYPSVTGGMQLMLMHGDDGTVFFAPRDSDGGNKVMRMEMAGDNVNFIQNVVANYDWSRNGKFALPYATEVGFMPDTWQNTTLQWYRHWALSTKWAGKNVRERNIAPWVEHADMWLRPGDTDSATVAALTKALDYYGRGVGLHWYYWHNYPFDTHYPDYFPAKPGFKQMMPTPSAAVLTSRPISTAVFGTPLRQATRSTTARPLPAARPTALSTPKSTALKCSTPSLAPQATSGRLNSKKSTAISSTRSALTESIWIRSVVLPPNPATHPTTITASVAAHGGPKHTAMS